VLEAMPALEVLKFEDNNNEINPCFGAEAFQPIIQTLYRRIGLQNLEKVLLQCRMSADLLAAFESSRSAKGLVALVLRCDIGVEGARALADVIGRNIFPALEMLLLYDNPRVSDEGAIVLAEALGNASRPFLRILDLVNIGMCDRGMSALASLVRQGRLERLEELNLSNNKGVTDNGIIALARAIEASGLPRLQHIRISKLDKMKVTILRFGAIAYAIIKGSPQLKSINVECNEQEAASLRTTIESMLRAAGRTASVKTEGSVVVT